MQLVVDANILLAALLRASTTRGLVFDPRLDLRAPEHIRNEVERHLVASDRFRSRLNMNQEELAMMLSLLFANVQIIDEKFFNYHLPQAAKLAPHRKDMPYIALALAFAIPVWSNDAGIRVQRSVAIITTKDLIAHLSRKLK